MSDTSAPSALRSELLSELNRALGRQDLQAAATIARRAIERGLDHPKFSYVLAQDQLARGRYDDALETLDVGLGQTPASAPLAILRAICLASAGLEEAAVDAFEGALELDPNSSIAASGLAQVLYNLGRYGSARAQYRLNCAATPDSPDPLAGLAMVAIREGQADEAMRLAGEALARQPLHPLALEAKADAQISNGDFVAAEDTARSLLGSVATLDQDPSTGLLRLGDALHGQERFSEAFEAYAAAKAELRRRYHAQFAASGREAMESRVRRLSLEMEAIDSALWPSESKHDLVRHGFILGFPRSGTTLLEEILAAHPDAVTLDERTTMGRMEAEFLERPGGLAALAALDAAALRAYRDTYWDMVDQLAPEREQSAVIDKQPIHSISLPIIARVFPNARVLLAIRDPRDVVLSCFRRGFSMNPSTFEFTTLESTARLYDAVMRLIVTCRERLHLNLRVVRHEDLVAGFDAEVSGILEFLGLGWADEVAGFAQSARGRAIRTPSANQIRKGLNAEAIGQWRCYEKELAPVLPILEPWVRHWGYSDSER